MRAKGINYDTGFFSADTSSHEPFDPEVVRREMRIIRDELHCTVCARSARPTLPRHAVGAESRVRRRSRLVRPVRPPRGTRFMGSLVRWSVSLVAMAAIIGATVAGATVWRGA